MNSRVLKLSLCIILFVNCKSNSNQNSSHEVAVNDSALIKTKDTISNIDSSNYYSSIALLDMLSAEKDGWVFLIGDGTPDRSLGIKQFYKDEKGNYYIDNFQSKITIEDGGILAITNSKESVLEYDCISIYKRDTNTIELYTWHDCARQNESFSVYQRASLNPLSFKDKYGIGVLVYHLGKEYVGDSMHFHTQITTIDSNIIELLEPAISSVKIVEEYNTAMFDNESDFVLFNNYPDYDIIHSICYESFPESGIYSVKYDDYEALYIQTQFGEFYSWSDFLLEIAFAVDPKNLNPNSLYSEPSSESEIISYEDIIEEYMLKVVEVKGNWIQIEVVTLCESESLNIKGWMKWKDDQELLIGISYIC